MSLFKRISNRCRITSGRLRYEVFGTGLSEDSVRSHLTADLRERLPQGEPFWKSLYNAYVEQCPENIRVVDNVWYAAKSDAIDAAMNRQITVLGNRLTMPAGHTWHTDLFHNKSWPKKYVKAISDIHPGTDLVLLWLQNRLYHLLDLSCAFAVKREERFAEEWMEQAVSWCRDNPYLVGVNWRSPMEMGLRLYALNVGLKEISWSDQIDSAQLRVILESIIQQGYYLSEHFSYWRGEANNHLIADAATLYAFASMWKILDASKEWMEKSEEVLGREIERQILPDGMDFENAFNYHLHVLDLTLLYLLFTIKNRKKPHPAVADGVRRMVPALLSVISPLGRLPRFGDDVEREFVILKNLDEVEGRTVSEPLIFSDFIKSEYLGTFQEAPWAKELLGLAVSINEETILNDAGYAALRSPNAHLVYCGGVQHDQDFHPGHMHADLGSFELELGGKMVFIDSGTYLYNFDREMRRHFRGSSAHNSLVVDGREVMECEDTFSWKSVARGRCLTVMADDGVKVVSSSHRIEGEAGAQFDHKRVIILSDTPACLVIDVLEGVSDGVGESGDEVSVGAPGKSPHTADLFFHMSSSALVSLADMGVKIAIGDGREAGPSSEKDSTNGESVFTFTGVSTGGYDLELLQDREDLRTWYSPVYNELRFGSTLMISCRFEEGLTVCHALVPCGETDEVPEYECSAGFVRAALVSGDVWEIELNPLRVRRNGKTVGTTGE